MRVHRLLLAALLLVPLAAEDTITLTDGRVLIGTYDEAAGTIATTKPFKAVIPIIKTNIVSIAPYDPAIDKAGEPARGSSTSVADRRASFVYLQRAQDAARLLRMRCEYESTNRSKPPPSALYQRGFLVEAATEKYVDAECAKIEEEANAAGTSILTKDGDYPYIAAHWYKDRLRSIMAEKNLYRVNRKWTETPPTKDRLKLE